MRISILLLVLAYFTSTTFAQNDSLYKSYKQTALKLYKSEKYLASAKEYSKAITTLGNKENANDRYDAACSWSLYGNLDSAFYNLFIAAKKLNWSKYKHTSIDTDLDALKNNKRWLELIGIIRANKRKTQQNMNLHMIEVLDSIYITDQKYRLQLRITEKKYGRESEQMQSLWKTIMDHDSINTIKITSILDKHGWLGPKEVEQSGSQTLFLVIQHADIKVQQKYLPMMRAAVKDKKASPSALALLEDRVGLRTNGKQIYGSQIGRDKDGNYYVSPLIDPENVDKRRAEVGLGPISSYLIRWKIKWDVSTHIQKSKELLNKSKKD